MPLSMSIGIGVDLEHVARFDDISSDHAKSLMEKIFTEDERAYCLKKTDPAQHLAARFASKEAIIKALGSLDINHVTYRDIEVTNLPNGAPQAACLIHPETTIMVSMSHTNEFAIAFALVRLAEL